MKNKTIFGGVGLLALTVIIMGASTASAATPLTRELSLGMSGSDVSTVQTFLSQDQALYPQGLVTGYFGDFTKNAVENFQTRNELPAVGRIGPMTLPVMNLQIATGLYMGMGVTSPITGSNVGASEPILSSLNVSTSRNNAVVTWNTNVSTTGAVYYSTSPLNLSEQVNSVGVKGASVATTDTSLRISQNIAISGLTPNTTYYYMVYSADQYGGVSVSWPSTFHTAN